MATYSGVLLGSASNGTRDQQTLPTYSGLFQVEKQFSYVSMVKEGINTSFAYGYRVADRSSYMTSNLNAKRVSFYDNYPTASFELLSEVGLGEKDVRILETNIYIADVLIGEHARNPLLGMSSVGIGYKMEVPIAIEKPIRRWPRDWHGDNMND